MLSKILQMLIMAMAVAISSLVTSPLVSAAEDQQTQCDMQLVYRSPVQNQNQLLQHYFDGIKWSEAVSFHSNPSGFSSAVTAASDTQGNLLVVWVEHNGSSNQLLYRVKSNSGNWLGEATELTATQGEKTTPVLIRSISGAIYLSWVSDQNKFDDVFLASWTLQAGWSQAEPLSEDNAFPDIRPSFEYVQDINGNYELMALWQARSEDGVYESNQALIETNLSISGEQAYVDEECSKRLSKVALPTGIEEGFLHFPQMSLDNYQSIKLR